MKNNRPLGKTQRALMESMRMHKHTYWATSACGWTWGTQTECTRICESLVRRGLMTETKTPIKGYQGGVVSTRREFRIVDPTFDCLAILK